jgi:nucleoid-associated protein YgaU
MTKETRVGLLVGMLFIIAFGLILAELTGTDAAPPAPAAAEEALGAYAHAPVIEDVPLPYEGSADPRPGDAVVSFGPGPPPGLTDGAVVQATMTPPPGGADRGGVAEMELHPGPAVLAARGTEGAALLPKPAPRPTPSPAPAPRPPAPRRRIHEVQANDTLIRIARRVYGKENELHYKLIYKANRRILPDEATLSIGQKLVIPPLPMATKPPATTARRTAPAPAPRARAAGEGEVVELDVRELGRRFASAPPRRSSARRVYVVQRGDCLTGIARRFLRDGSRAAVLKIYNANRSLLDSPDRLPVGARLNIPS